VTLFISVAIFSGFLIIAGHSFSEYFMLIPFIFMLQQILAYAIGLTLALLTVFVRDLKEIVGIVLQIWFWFTPIVYVKDILPGFAKKIIVFNPVFILSDSYQNIILWNRLPDIPHLLILTAVTFALLLCSYFLYIKLESDVKDFL
jgi:lipopolysaccharide transport system permease protein